MQYQSERISKSKVHHDICVNILGLLGSVCIFWVNPRYRVQTELTQTEHTQPNSFIMCLLLQKIPRYYLNVKLLLIFCIV